MPAAAKTGDLVVWARQK